MVDIEPLVGFNFSYKTKEKYKIYKIFCINFKNHTL